MRRRCVNTPYTITTVYGNVPGYPLNNGFHTGVDYVSNDSLIVAPMNSRVVATGKDAVNGNYLVLEANGYRDWFSHISEYKVTSGNVTIGQPLAVMGATGAATGVHVHHSLRVNGVLVDAEKHIKEITMATPTDVLRIIASEVEGFDMTKTHKGEYDKILTDAWGSKPPEDYIRHAWNVQKTHRGHLTAQIKAKDAQIATQTKRADVAEKTLAEANKEIDRLKAQLAIQSDDTQLLNGFGETLRKLIVRLGLKG
jgi:murein DD-endopeptidase MepM/ murein hydrolase activator NlpD